MIRMQEGNMPHIYWIDLKNDGVYTECAVMKRDQLGNIYFFPLKALDNIDKRRLARILNNRNATSFELWDLMSNITLNNGVNALSYFHQLVEVLTPGGRVMKPQLGVVGAVGSTGTYDTRNADARTMMEQNVAMASRVAAEAAAKAAADIIKESHQYSGQSPSEPTPASAKRPTTKPATTTTDK